MLFVMSIALPLRAEETSEEAPEAIMHQIIPPLAVIAAAQGEPPLHTPLDNAFVLSEDIGNLQTRLQTLERQIENHKREAHRAGTQRNYLKRNTYLAAAKQAEAEAQKIRDQIAQKESERHAKIEEVRRLGSSVSATIKEAILKNEIARDRILGEEIRRLDPEDVKDTPGTAEIPKKLWPLSREFSSDLSAISAMSKDAAVVERLSQQAIDEGPAGETRFMGDMRSAADSLQASRGRLEDRFRQVSREIRDLQDKKKDIKEEAQGRKIDNELNILRTRQENLQYALLAGTLEARPPMDPKKLEQEGQKEREILREQKRLRAQGRDEEEIRRVATAMRVQAAPKEDQGFCSAAWDVTKGIAGGAWSGIKAVGSGIGWVGGKIGSGLLETGSFFGQHGTPIKQALFSTFSALAQYRYTKKGSQNSDTQVYRGLAIALGLDMGFKGQMPRAMMDTVDPLTPFKRPALSSQQVISGQDEVLRNVLNIGGNPASAGSFPYGAQDQLQAILESTRPGAPGSFVPGSRFPASAAGSFPGIYDPSFRNFTGQAYNGFPPLPTTPTQGAILNPNYGAGNPFVMGSGLAAIAQQTASENQGKQNLGSLVAATAAERGGIQNFRQQLEGINPPGNSLKDLIDGVARTDASSRALTGTSQNISQILAQGNASFANSQMLEQASRYNTELQKISNLNKELFDAAQRFRRFDFEIQRDEDGLMAGSPKDWSKNMNARNQALLDLLDITQRRNETMTNIAYLVYNPALYQRILKLTPTVPSSSPPAGASELWHFFFVRPVWAAEILEADPSFVPGWKEILKEELDRAERELAKNRRERAKLIPPLEKLVALDPDGVHEINVPVLQVEELNMKAIVLQTQQNLDKLKKAEDAVKVSLRMAPSEKEEVTRQIKDYRFLLSQLEEEAKQCANELAKVERLQLEKRTEFEIFHHFKPKGEKLLGRTPSSL